MSSWVESIDKREAAVAVIRECDVAIDRFYQSGGNLRTPGGMISVGSADADYFIKADALATFLRNIRNGKTPDEALAIAKNDAREMVTNHNKKRKDINWERWEGMADSTLETWWRKFKALESNNETL